MPLGGVLLTEHVATRKNEQEEAIREPGKGQIVGPLAYVVPLILCRQLEAHSPGIDVRIDNAGLLMFHLAA